MKKTRTQIQKEIEKLIDKLELRYIKDDLLNDFHKKSTEVSLKAVKSFQKRSVSWGYMKE